VVLLNLLGLGLLPQHFLPCLRFPLQEPLRVALRGLIPALNDLVQLGQVLLFEVFPL
jgi:hypothetical protein